MRIQKNNNKGFTFIELIMVVLFFIGIFMTAFGLYAVFHFVTKYW